MLNASDFSKKQIIFLFTNQGEKLSFSNDNVIVKDKEGKIKHQSMSKTGNKLNLDR